MKFRSAIAALVIALPLLAGTFPVSTGTLGEPPDTRSVPELAAGRNGYLTTWTDARSGSLVLLATRIAADGSVLDPTGIVLAPVATAARVVWNGERYLVFFASGADLAVRSVSEDGSVGATRTVVALAHPDLMQPIEVATNGKRIVVAYAGDHPAWDVRARAHAVVLTMDGNVVNDLLLDDVRTDGLQPSVATNGDGFVAGWNRPVFTAAQELDGYALHAVRLDDRGVRLDPQPRRIGATGMQASLHPNGDAYVADHDWESWSVSADLSQTGAPVDRPPGRFFTLQGAAAVIDEEIATISGAEIPRWVAVSRYDGDGRPGPAKTILRGTDDGMHSIAGASAVQRGDDVLVTWLTNAYSDNYPIHAFTTLVSADDLSPHGERRLLTRSTAPQREPAFAAGATEALVAWQQSDGIYAARVSHDGRALDGAGIRISSGELQHPPAVAFHDGRYAIAFGQSVDDQQWEVVVRFLTSDGTLLPEAVRIPVGRWMGEVAMASGGGTLALVYSDDGVALRATRIHAGGTYDPPVDVLDVAGYLLDPVIAFNGSQFLIAWIDTYVDYDWFYQHAIAGRRMTPDLQFPEAAPYELATLGFGRHHADPSLASDGVDWYVTWTTAISPYDPNPPSDDRRQVRITRIEATGKPESLLGKPLVRGFGAEIAWTGSRLVAAWKDDAPNTPLSVAPLTSALTLDRVQTLDAAPLVYEHRQVALARWGSGWAAVYPFIAGPETGHVPRIFATVEGKTKGKARAIR